MRRGLRSRAVTTSTNSERCVKRASSGPTDLWKRSARFPRDHASTRSHAWGALHQRAMKEHEQPERWRLRYSQGLSGTLGPAHRESRVMDRDNASRLAARRPGRLSRFSLGGRYGAGRKRVPSRRLTGPVRRTVHTQVLEPAWNLLRN